jgi:hypothetical protein
MVPVYSHCVMKALTLALTFLAAVAFAHAADLRTHIAASSQTIANAIKKKDFATLNKEIRAGTTSDFKYIENGKSETIDVMMQGMKMGLAMMDKITVCKTKTLTLKQKGNTAVCTMEHTMVGRMKGQDKKTHTMSFTGVSEDTYVNQGGKWKMSSMAWKSQKQSMEGKAVPSGMGH